MTVSKSPMTLVFVLPYLRSNISCLTVPKSSFHLIWKIFIGGLAKETTIDTFVNYFGKYGEITDSVIMKDRLTGRSRGFGFITYAEPSVVDTVIAETHVITGKQNISEQVASYMRDPSRMIKGMQQRRSVVPVFGDVVNADGDPELLDDSEFYQQLLREFFETVNVGSSETAFYARKRLQTKKQKIVDRRASKSRKIRSNSKDNYEDDECKRAHPLSFEVTSSLLQGG